MPELEWEGEHLRAGGDIDDVCEGNLEYMDAMVGELQQRLGTPGDGLVDFYYFSTSEHPLSAHCNDTPIACTNEYQEVFSRWIPEEHELVHAVHAEVGVSHRFLEEGLAEFLGDDGRSPGRGEPQGTPSEAITAVHDQDLPFGYYAIAGHFVSFLDREFGTPGTMERVDELDFDSTAPEVEAALGAGIDGGFAAIEQEYEAVPKCAQAAYRDAEPMCNVAATLFEQCTPNWDASADVYVEVECSESDVLGPRQDEIWTYRTFEISNAGTYSALATAATEFTDGVVLKRCDGGCQSPPITIPVLAEDDFLVQEDIVLEPGRYLVRFTRPVDDPATIRIRFAGDACE